MAEKSPLEIHGIGQIAIRAQNLDRAVSFYRDTLKLKHLFTAASGMAFFDCNGVRLMLTLPEAPEFDHPSSILYFRVDGIQAAYDALGREGVTLVSPPQRVASFPDYNLWLAFFRDSEGNLMSLMSEILKS